MAKFFRSLETSDKKENQFFNRDNSLKKIEEVENENSESFMDYNNIQKSNIRNSTNLPNQFMTHKQHSPYQENLRTSPRKISLNSFDGGDMNYTCQIMIVGINPNIYQNVIECFKEFGTIEEIVYYKPNTNYIVLRYSSYKEALKAKECYNPICISNNNRIIVLLFYGNEFNLNAGKSNHRESIEKQSNFIEKESKSYLRKFLEVFFY